MLQAIFGPKTGAPFLRTYITLQTTWRLILERPGACREVPQGTSPCEAGDITARIPWPGVCVQRVRSQHQGGSPWRLPARALEIDIGHTDADYLVMVLPNRDA